MAEIFLAVSNLVFGLAILTYFYFREVKGKDNPEIKLQALHNFYRELNLSKDNLIKEILVKKDEAIQRAFVDYLKHIQILEKLVTSKPDRFTQHILSNQTANNIPITPNDIEKTEEEQKEESFQEVFSKIPITPETKVAFEGEKLPEEVIS